MTHSAVLIIPAALLDQANALGASMGWGPTSYTVALGAADADPEAEEPTVTYYGCQVPVSQQFIRWVRGLEPLPDPAAQPIIDALIADFAHDPTVPEAERHALAYRAHFVAVLDAHGLREV